MNTPSAQQRTCSDAQLTAAVAASSSWRGVLRALGLNATSAGAIRVVRGNAARLGLDTSHFRGKRTWSDAQLTHAICAARSWDEALAILGLSANSGNARTHIKGHAIRLGVDFSHLAADAATEAEPSAVTPDLAHLRDAGESIAAAWFTLRGCTVLFPIEPTTYDLVVSLPQGLSRVQVKTTTASSKNGWQVTVSRRPYSPGNLAPRVPYDPEVIDHFFIIDGDLNLYLIPSKLIAGRIGLLLRAYRQHIVGNAGGLLGNEAVGARPSA